MGQGKGGIQLVGKGLGETQLSNIWEGEDPRLSNF